MTLLDAYALIAVFAGEPAADEVRPLLREGAKIAATNLAEVYDRLMRLRRMPLSEVDMRVERLKRARGLTVFAIDEAIARRAGELRAQRYQRTARPLSLADCVAAATAEHLGEPLATPDVQLAELARSEGIDVVSLPDSTGKRP